MNLDFWKSRWEKRQTGWHLEQIHPKLIQFWPRLSLDSQATVLVPFCGKSLDLDWLTEQHHRVIGVEWVEEPSREVISRHTSSYNEQKADGFNVFTGDSLQIWNGDFFNLQPDHLPSIDAVYDRGSLVSLPRSGRSRYVRCLTQWTHSHTQMLIICYEYNQDEMQGPPFSVPRTEIDTLYGNHFTIELIHNESILDQAEAFRRRGLTSYMNLNVYHLKARQR
jgi:thiopurine S-methyltransferase